MSEPHAKEWALSESGNIAQNKSPIPLFDLYDWCLVTVFRHHSNSAFIVGVQPNIVRRFIAAVLVDDFGDGVGGTVETRAEQGGIPRTSLNIPWLSWENLGFDRDATRNQLNGTSTLILD